MTEIAHKHTHAHIREEIIVFGALFIINSVLSVINSTYINLALSFIILHLIVLCILAHLDRVGVCVADYYYDKYKNYLENCLCSVLDTVESGSCMK